MSNTPASPHPAPEGPGSWVPHEGAPTPWSSGQRPDGGPGTPAGNTGNTVPPRDNTFQPGAGEGSVPPPEEPGSRRFFASIRRLGLHRSEERWCGGVASGVARYFGIDPVLVRCVWLVLALSTGIGFLVYGLGWLLLPEEHDGRIHLEQAFAGDLSAGLSGAVITCVVGAGSGARPVVSLWWGRWVWEDFALVGVGWIVLWAAVIYGVIIWLSRNGSRRSPDRDRPWTEPEAQPSPAPAGTGSVQGQAAPFPYTPPSRPAAPSLPPQRPCASTGPERRVSLAVLGLILLTLALGSLYSRSDGHDPMSTAILQLGAVTVLLGLGVVVSALRGRRGGWMAGLGVTALVLALLMTAVNDLAPQGVLWGTVLTDEKVVTVSAQDLEGQGTLTPGADGALEVGTYSVGEIVIDLRQLDPDVMDGRHVRVRLGAGDVTVLTAQGQPVTVSTRAGVGQASARTATPWRSEDASAVRLREDRYRLDQTMFSTTFTMRSPQALAGRDSLHVDIELGLGEVEVSESGEVGAYQPASPSPLPRPTASRLRTTSPDPQPTSTQ